MINDLLANLFKVYKAILDREFVSYIRKKEDEYEEGGRSTLTPSCFWLTTSSKPSNRPILGMHCPQKTNSFF